MKGGVVCALFLAVRSGWRTSCDTENCCQPYLATFWEQYQSELYRLEPEMTLIHFLIKQILLLLVQCVWNWFSSGRGSPWLGWHEFQPYSKWPMTATQRFQTSPGRHSGWFHMPRGVARKQNCSSPLVTNEFEHLFIHLRTICIIQFLWNSEC